MDQPITDYGAFLREAKEAVTDFNEMQQRETALSQQLGKNRRQLETEAKAAADHVSQTIKKRAADIASGYDKELSRGQERLKKARFRREKAKSQGMKERICEETSAFREENRQLRQQMKTTFQQNKVPAICRSSWYYRLYSPRRLAEFAAFFAAFLVCFLVIPYGSYLLIGQRKPLYLGLIYLACIFVFGGLYVVAGNRTKERYSDTIKAGREILNRIYSNDKKMKRIAREIRKDKNDAAYHLQKHDDEIAEIEQMMAETACKKDEALHTFETVTKKIIADEMNANHKKKLDLLKETCEVQEGELRALNEEIKNKSIFITNRFGAYLEREFLQPRHLDALLDLMENGRAANLSEAMEQYKKQHA